MYIYILHTEQYVFFRLQGSPVELQWLRGHTAQQGYKGRALIVLKTKIKSQISNQGIIVLYWVPLQFVRSHFSPKTASLVWECFFSRNGLLALSRNHHNIWHRAHVSTASRKGVNSMHPCLPCASRPFSHSLILNPRAGRGIDSYIPIVKCGVRGPKRKSQTWNPLHYTAK